jgi:hypothetical protein
MCLTFNKYTTSNHLTQFILSLTKKLTMCNRNTPTLAQRINALPFQIKLIVVMLMLLAALSFYIAITTPNEVKHVDYTTPIDAIG